MINLKFLKESIMRISIHLRIVQTVSSAEMTKWLVGLLLALLLLNRLRVIAGFVRLRSECCVLHWVNLLLVSACHWILRRWEWWCVVIKIAILRHVVIRLVQRSGWLCLILVGLVKSELILRQTFHLVQIVRSHSRIWHLSQRRVSLFFLLFLGGSVRIVIPHLKFK